MERTPWYQFLDRVDAARESLDSPERVWYRGHANSSWPLLPSILRRPDGLEREQNVFQEFKRSAARLFKKRDDDWETLFDMQHYGIPTRLFDWSEVLGIALAFAVLNYDPSIGDLPCIYVLDPVALNKMSGLVIIQELPSKDFQYKSIYWEKKPFGPIHPIAVDPPLQSERMFAQKATFTVHGEDLRGLEQQCPAVVRKVTLPLEALDAAREFLDYADLTQYAIYPDIVGMARYITRKAFGDKFI